MISRPLIFKRQRRCAPILAVACGDQFSNRFDVAAINDAGAGEDVTTGLQLVLAVQEQPHDGFETAT